MRARAGVVAGVAIGLCLVAAPARAHATLVSAEPAAGAQVGAPPSEVLLVFSEQPDASASEIRVVATDGSVVSTGALLAGRAPHSLRVRVRALDHGVYTVTWRVLSRVDGHVTGGAFAFGVGVSPQGAVITQDAPRSPPPSGVGIAGRVALYAALIVLVGLASVAAFVRVEPPGGARLFVVAAGVGLAGAAAIGAGQLAQSGIRLGDAFGTSIGRAFVARAVPLLVAGAVAAAVRATRARSVAVAVAGIAGVVTHVANGHAAGTTTPLVSIVGQSIHVLAAAAWIGGIALLAVALRGGRAGAGVARAVRTVSSIAFWSVLALVASGVARGLQEAPRPSLLVSTGAGRALLAKMLLLIVLVVLGGVNRYRNVARAETDARPLRRVLGVELGVAVVVLVVTALLASIAPPRSSSAAAVRPERVTATGVDFGSTVRARLTVTPGPPGPNRFEVRLETPDGEPFHADDVTLTFRLVGGSLEPTTMRLQGRGNRFAGEGSDLAVPGPWAVHAQIRSGTSIALVPLAVFPRVEQNGSTVPGDPTIHDFTLAGGARVQLYVDPSRPGRAEVHATFFDASGTEASGLRAMTLVGTAPGGMPRPLASRQLTPGHIVADVELRAGRWRFDATATTEEGRRLWASFEQTIQP